MPSWLLAPITVADLPAEGVPETASGLPAGLDALRQELLPDLSAAEWYARYRRLLAVDRQQFVAAPQVHERAAEAWWLHDGSIAIGMLLLHFYAWPLFAPQICLRAERNADASLNSLALAPCATLFAPPKAPRFAAELAAYWVHPAWRGQGVGRQLFAHAMAVFDACLQPGDIGCTAARAALSKAQGQAIFQHLLAEEERANGSDPASGQVRITGRSVATAELSAALGFDCSRLPVHPAAVATVHLAEAAGMRFCGFLRTTSSLYGRIW